MNEQKLNICYYSDSDVMLYDNISTVYSNYSGYDASFTMTESQTDFRWAASGCCSYWKAESLNGFCDFILNIYSSGKKTLLDENIQIVNHTWIGWGMLDNMWQVKINTLDIWEFGGE